MEDCIFCKIINEEIPSNKIYEDEKVIAILDIKPINPGHTLVIPKHHFVNVLDTPEPILESLMSTVKKLANPILNSTNSKGFNVHINNNKIAGQAVNHIHFHIIPRTEHDGRELWHGAEYPPGEAKEIENTIKVYLK